jgi:hypothetical protein
MLRRPKISKNEFVAPEEEEKEEEVLVTLQTKLLRF